MRLLRWAGSLGGGRLTLLSLLILGVSAVVLVEGNGKRRLSEARGHEEAMEVDFARADRAGFPAESTLVVNGALRERLPEEMRSLQVRRAAVERRLREANAAFQHEMDRARRDRVMAPILISLGYTGLATVAVFWLLRFVARTRS